MSSTEAGTSSSIDYSHPCPKNGNFDVFLSFRGEDTRLGFTGNLYRSLLANKIFTFMDVVLMGEDINHIFEMIGKSRMAVLIYSERFASSDWCLRELDTILQRRIEKKLLMVPIFYKIDLQELKHLNGKTAEYLNKHVQEHGEASVQKWKDALTNLGQVSGLSYKDTHGRYEYDFIKEVVTRIKEKLEEREEIQDVQTQDNMMECPILEVEETQDVQTQDNNMECPILEVQVQFTSLGLGAAGHWFKSMIGLDNMVTSVDLHRTKPWVLLSFISRRVRIWDYNTRAEEKLIKVPSLSLVAYAKFVPEKHWIVVRGLKGLNKNGFACVFDYNTLKNLKEFNESIFMEVHPTLPYVITATKKHIKLWNWENNWACDETFKGHSNSVMKAAFNPKDPSSFATVSLDGIIKIWSLGSSVATFTINTNAKQFFCIEYFIGNYDKLYILGGSNDCSVKIWDYESKTLVLTLESHKQPISAILVHPELPIILTGSEDIHIWNKNTHELLLVWKGTHGQILSLGFIKATGEVIIGCRNGMVVIKLFFSRRV